MSRLTHRYAIVRAARHPLRTFNGEDMKLGIIAAGEGSRLRQEGVDTPKPLLLIKGVPMIERIIRTAIRCGFREIFCIVNEDIAPRCSYLPSAYQREDIRFSLLVQSTPSSLHSLAVLAPHLKGGDFCLTTTDTIFTEEEFDRYLFRAQHQPTGDGLLAITRYIDDENPLYAEVDGQMRIVRFSDVPDRLEWVTGGLYMFSARVLDLIDPALQSGTQRLRNYLRMLLEHDFQLFGFPFSRMIDVDHASDIAAAEDLLSHEQQDGVGA